MPLVVLHGPRLRRHRRQVRRRSAAPVEHDDFNGTIWKVGQNLAWDPHAEKGDRPSLRQPGRPTTSTRSTDNRFAFYCHDIPTGAAIEYRRRPENASSQARDNTIYLLAVNLTDVAKIQTGGNGIQFWGVNGQPQTSSSSGENATGYALFDDGMNSGTSLRGVTVEYGRATNTNQNPRYAGQNPWSDRLGEVYQSVRPAPRRNRG